MARFLACLSLNKLHRRYDEGEDFADTTTGGAVRFTARTIPVPSVRVGVEQSEVRECVLEIRVERRSHLGESASWALCRRYLNYTWFRWAFREGRLFNSTWKYKKKTVRRRTTQSFANGRGWGLSYEHVEVQRLVTQLWVPIVRFKGVVLLFGVVFPLFGAWRSVLNSNTAYERARACAHKTS